MKKFLMLLALMGAALTAAAVERVFIPLTPTEFSEGFNRASQVYKLKYRLPVWAAKAGKFSATLAPGITVAVVGIDQGDAIDRITVTCKLPEGCQQGLVAAALAVDPQMDLRAFASYVEKRFQGQLEGQSMQQRGVYYFVDAGKKLGGGIEMVVEAVDE